jgi:hypothetical protein
MIDGPAITASGVGADAAGAAAAAQAAAELAAKNAMAYKLGFADWAEMEAAARASGTLIDGGYINTQLIEAGAIKAGMIDVEDLRATEGFFEDIDVTGTASVKELLFKDFEPGDIILKKALDLLIPEQALQTKYSKRQICGTGNVKITLEANHVHSGYSTTLDIVRNRAGVKSSIYVEVFSSYSGWVEREITPISVIEGDIIEFKGYGTGGGLLGVSTLSLRNICIKIDTYPGFMSWIGTDSESSTDPGFPR